jgi:hypothetical protein
MKRVIFTLAMIGVWCVAVLPVHAADDEARVLILNGLDPYLPAYLAIDNAMRTSLAKESTKRIVLYSEPLDAQRFAVGPRESELVASLAKKYDGLQIDVVVTVMKPALGFIRSMGRRFGLARAWCFTAFPTLPKKQWRFRTMLPAS